MPEATSKPMPVIVVYLVFAALIVAIISFIVAGYRTYKKDMYIATTPIAITARNLDDLEPVAHAGRFPGKDVAQKQLDTRQERVTGKAVEAKKEDPNKKPAKPPKPDDKKKSDKDPNDMLCRIRFPRGYDSPTYLTPPLEKEIYVVHQFDVVAPTEPGKGPTRRIAVAEIDREPLQFTAFARSVRLGALHDLKHAKIIEEGPVLLPGAAQYAHIVEQEKGPISIKGADAYGLLVEGDDDNGAHVRSRQVVVQGEGTTVYVIKATAPATEWAQVGELFDTAISTFEVVTPVAAATAPADSQPATQAATQPEATPAK